MLEDAKQSKIDRKEIARNAAAVAELGIDLQQRCASGERYVAYLKATFDRANRTIASLHQVARKSLEQAKKLIAVTLNSRYSDEDDAEMEKLLRVVEKQLSEFDLKDHCDTSWINDKNKLNDCKIKSCDLPSSCSSLKSVKADVDEKYPENLSKESLIDLNSVINLPPVPEDIFTSFSGKPTRSSSLSSLKSIRKVKLFLQRAESSEDEDNSSENEDHDFTKLVYGDASDEPSKLPILHAPMKKLILGNIKEETQD